MKQNFLHPDARARAMALIADDKLIQAIKLIRQATGMGLAQAKEYAESLQIELISERVPADLESYARTLIAQGDRVQAGKAIRQQTGIGRQAAKNYVEALRNGFTRSAPPVAAPSSSPHRLSDRVRAFKAAHDHESAIAAVRAETGMTRPEAERFVAALD